MYHPGARVFTKSSIMISLIGYYACASPSVDWLFFLALLLALMGDVFLLGESYFLFGLSSFLLMQLLYAVCFNKQRGQLNLLKGIGVLSIIGITVLLLFKLVPTLDQQMKWPVIIYASAIGLMAITAITRTAQYESYFLVLLGVLSFLVSDAILGWSKFSDDIPLSGLLIMSTYILAQYLIVKGYLQYEYGNNGHDKSVLT